MKGKKGIWNWEGGIEELGMTNDECGMTSVE
jgi:hypothetical protein